MNRRGFFSSLAGAGALAAAPPALVAAPAAIAPIKSAPLAPPSRSELEMLVASVACSLGRVLRQNNICPLAGPVLVQRLGETVICRTRLAFSASEGWSPGSHLMPMRADPITFSRQSCRGVRRSWPGCAANPDSVTNAVEGIACDILSDWRQGCRGLVFGKLPDVSPYGVCDCKIVRVGDASMRGMEVYFVTSDEFIIRFDVMFGWLETPRAWYPCSGGSQMFVV